MLWRVCGLPLLACVLWVQGCAEYVAPEGPYACTTDSDCLDNWRCDADAHPSLSICVLGASADAVDSDGMTDSGANDSTDGDSTVALDL